MVLAIILFVHVLISLAALGAGFLFYQGLRDGRPRAESFFLASTTLTGLTGYVIPAHTLLPAHVVGAISLALLAVAYKARATRGRAFIITTMSAFYLNLLVLTAQLFKRIPEIRSMEPVAQLLLLGAFLAATAGLAWPRRSTPESHISTSGA